MNSRERLTAAIEGGRPDRTPFTAWRHFYLTPPAGPDSKMAQAELEFYDLLRPDLLKVMHDVEYQPAGPIESPGDWRQFTVLNPASGKFGDQLYTLRQIRKGLNPSVPMIDTLFNVYHYAQKLSQGRLIQHLRTDPEPVHCGLKAIAASLAGYARATLALGCEGIYYALDGASEDGHNSQNGSFATRDEYISHFLPYDKQILWSVAGAPFSILHLHGYKNLYFGIVHDLPAAAVCWSDRAASPSLAETKGIHRGCIMGGLDETAIETMSRDQIVAQGVDAIQTMRGRRFILSPGCSVPMDLSEERLIAIREAALQ